MKTRFHFLIAFFVLVSPVCGQGTFQNLDFENPVLPLNPDESFLVPIADALPGWSGYIGDASIGYVAYNTVSLGAATISFHGQSSLEPVYNGNYCVILQVQVPGGIPNAAIGQVGQIPFDAQSLIFYAYNVNIAVSFAGQSVETFDLGDAGGSVAYHKFGADVTAFAGQTGELRFTAVYSSGNLDFIQFSPEPVPEPSAFALFAFVSLLLGWRFFLAAKSNHASSLAAGSLYSLRCRK